MLDLSPHGEAEHDEHEYETRERDSEPQAGKLSCAATLHSQAALRSVEAVSPADRFRGIDGRRFGGLRLIRLELCFGLSHLAEV